MSDLRSVIVVGDGPVKDEAGLHGRDIGYIWASGSVQLTVDYEQLHDGWVPIVIPTTWRDTGKQGWVKYARCAVDDPQVVRLLVSYYSDGRAPTVQVVK